MLCVTANLLLVKGEEILDKSLVILHTIATYLDTHIRPGTQIVHALLQGSYGKVIDDTIGEVNVKGVLKEVHEWLEPTAVPENIDVDLECGNYAILTVFGLHMTTVKEETQVLSEACLETWSPVSLTSHPQTVRLTR